MSVPVSYTHLDVYKRQLQSLPVNYRMAVVLYDLEGFSYEEISGILDCSIGTVRSRIHRGRRLLRKKLAPYVYQETEVGVG